MLYQPSAYCSLRMNRMSDAMSLQSSLIDTNFNEGLTAIPDNSMSLNYPRLLAPLQSTAAAFAYSLFFFGYALARWSPSTYNYYLKRLLQFFPMLARLNLTKRKVGSATLGALLIFQEFQLQSRLISDFRALTKGFWSEVDSITLHHLRRSSTNALAIQLHMFHGFGANCLSWLPIMALFRGNAANAVAHDIPGFGFNPRLRKVPISVSFPTIYRPLWNARASLSIRLSSSEIITASSMAPVVLMGHSLGSVASIAAAAAVAYDKVTAVGYKSGEGINCTDIRVQMSNVTLVLVDPALSFSKTQQKQKIVKGTSSPGDPKPCLETSLKNLEKVALGVKESELQPPSSSQSVLMSCLRYIVTVTKSVLLLPLRIFLRRLVHTDKLWYEGLGAAWGKSSGVRPDTVWRYKLASMALGFDTDFGRFLASQRSVKNHPDSSSKKKCDDFAFANPEIVPGVTQLDVLVGLVDLGVKVVIVHGTDDRLIPIGNSLRMADLVQHALPDGAGGGPDLQVLPLEGLGHVPHEEDPVGFLRKLNSIGINLLD